MMKKFLATAFVLLPLFLISATRNTSSSGNWNTAGNWGGNVPGGADNANVNHALTINTNIATTKGDYTINQPITDNPGGTAYTLSISGTGGDQGNFDVNANATFEGALSVNSNGTLTVRAGDTLFVGNATFANGCSVIVETGAVLIINGNLTNNNNSNGVVVNGKMIVNGSVTGGNGSVISGSGSLNATGSIDLSGDGEIFGSTDDCIPGPCGVGTPPLPIELASFHANFEDDKVVLKWTTLSEINNDYFTLERSENALEFHVIEEISGAGNSREALLYHAEDNDPLPHVNYYRLKQTDFNGAYEYSSIVAVSNAVKQKEAFILGPLPADHFLNLNLEQLNGHGTLQVIDVRGSKVLAKSIDNTNTALDIQSLMPGFYILVVIDQYGQTLNQGKFYKK